MYLSDIHMYVFVYICVCIIQYVGVIFCIGGRGASGDPFRTIECYDLRKDRWFQVCDMSTKRRHVGVVAVAGKIFSYNLD